MRPYSPALITVTAEFASSDRYAGPPISARVSSCSKYRLRVTGSAIWPLSMSAAAAAKTRPLWVSAKCSGRRNSDTLS